VREQEVDDRFRAAERAVDRRLHRRQDGAVVGSAREPDHPAAARVAVDHRDGVARASAARSVQSPFRRFIDRLENAPSTSAI
jgi:hypothetical protein